MFLLHKERNGIKTKLNVTGPGVPTPQSKVQLLLSQLGVRHPRLALALDAADAACLGSFEAVYSNDRLRSAGARPHGRCGLGASLAELAIEELDKLFRALLGNGVLGK